jgi:hypothetical protein
VCQFLGLRTKPFVYHLLVREIDRILVAHAMESAASKYPEYLVRAGSVCRFTRVIDTITASVCLPSLSPDVGRKNESRGARPLTERVGVEHGYLVRDSSIDRSYDFISDGLAIRRLCASRKTPRSRSSLRSFSRSGGGPDFPSTWLTFSPRNVAPRELYCLGVVVRARSRVQLLNK